MDLNAVPGVSWYKYIYIYIPRESGVKRHPPLSCITLTLCAHAIKGPQWQSRNNQASAWPTLSHPSYREPARGRRWAHAAAPAVAAAASATDSTAYIATVGAVDDVADMRVAVCCHCL